MAEVLVYWTTEIQEAVISGPQATAAYLRHLGDHARPCFRSGCKRPDGHNGRHYYTEDDVRSIPLHGYRTNA